MRGGFSRGARPRGGYRLVKASLAVALVGSASFVFASTATPSLAIGLSGAGATIFGSTAALGLSTALAGVGGMSFGGAGHLGLTTALAGAGLMIFGSSAALGLNLGLSGTGAWLWSSAASLLPPGVSWNNGDFLAAFAHLTPNTVRAVTGPAILAGYIRPNSADPRQITGILKGPVRPPSGATLSFTIAESIGLLP